MTQTTYPISKIRSGEIAVRIENYEQYKKLCEAVSDKWNNEKTYCDKFEYYGMYEGGTTVTYITSTELVDRTLIDFQQIDWEEGKEEVIMDDEKYLQVANNLIFKTVSGKFGLTSIDEHDQVDGYYDTYKEAFFSLKLIMQLKELTSLKAENERLKDEKKELRSDMENLKEASLNVAIKLVQQLKKIKVLESSQSSQSSQETELDRKAWELHLQYQTMSPESAYMYAKIFIDYRNSKGGKNE